MPQGTARLRKAVGPPRDAPNATNKMQRVNALDSIFAATEDKAGSADVNGFKIVKKGRQNKVHIDEFNRDFIPEYRNRYGRLVQSSSFLIVRSLKLQLHIKLRHLLIRRTVPHMTPARA